MNQIWLRLLIPVPLVLAVLGFTFYLQYSKYNLGLETRGAPPVSFVDYAKYSADLLVNKYKSRQAVANFRAADTLPAEPEGWYKTDYLDLHGEKITGAPYPSSALSTTTEGAMQKAFRLASQGETQKAAASYVRGDKIVSVYTKVLKKPDPNTLEADVAARLENAVFIEGAQANDGLTVIDLGGVEMQQLPQVSEHFIRKIKKAVRYRRFEANIGDQLRVFAMSNAPIEDVAAVLSGLKTDMLLQYAAATGKQAPGPAPEVEQDQLADAASAGLAGRISKLFATNAREEEIQPPARMTCRMRKGAKHCFFPEEE
jgi:hypothetical protein